MGGFQARSVILLLIWSSWRPCGIIRPLWQRRKQQHFQRPSKVSTVIAPSGGGGTCTSGVSDWHWYSFHWLNPPPPVITGHEGGLCVLWEFRAQNAKEDTSLRQALYVSSLLTCFSVRRGWGPWKRHWNSWTNPTRGSMCKSSWSTPATACWKSETE